MHLHEIPVKKNAAPLEAALFFIWLNFFDSQIVESNFWDYANCGATVRMTAHRMVPTNVIITVCKNIGKYASLILT